MIRHALIAAVALGLAGCGTLPLPGTAPADLYDLSPKNSFSENLPTVGWQLIIDEPVATSAVNTSRIALKPSNLEVRYFADAQWIDRAPKMIQSLLVESFENSNRITSVGRYAINLTSDFRLMGTLREFQAEYAVLGEAPDVRVTLNLKLVREPQGHIVAARTFEERVPSTANTMPEIVHAFDLATGQVLKRSVEWALREMAEIGVPKPRRDPS
ncbi:ABC-type transport auxiliary lipoprotein family protein [Futiania mangrovi]|uniref:ABC-type transport auxiliary lipoprotein family protein n=1 Tax=Futiania mangrovi TaxID=2959716 RepID=A0A9J6PBR3_9PROT|nr:ABC-type transport auxiliary lipoprotein family protein [Futiania mangrovii]MCP1335019.1 ABC-type transport auxiliary lipoprotein family protein [Futiania mangrovii]